MISIAPSFAQNSNKLCRGDTSCCAAASAGDVLAANGGSPVAYGSLRATIRILTR